ncbi:MAG: glyoxalase [Lachnospiraceae bacterium]|nr:glyoxalase [Lachnospiraceae bacterium]
MNYDDIVLETFLKDQLKLFPQKVAKTKEEADEVLSDCLAEVLNSEEEVLEYLEDEMDITGMTKEEVIGADEVFVLPDGRFLVVEG